MLNSLIELAGSMAQLRNECAADILHGCFLAMCKLKNLVLQPFQREILNSQIQQYARVEIMSEEIVKCY